MKTIKYFGVLGIIGLAQLAMVMPAFAADPLVYPATGKMFNVTNLVTVLTNEHVSGRVWDYVTNANVLRSYDTFARLESLGVRAQTNAPLNFFFFSRPITAPTRNAAWALTPAEMQYCLGAPVVLNAGDYSAAGTNWIGGTNNINLLLYSTWTNTSIYTLITVSGAISNNTASTNVTLTLQGERIY